MAVLPITNDDSTDVNENITDINVDITRLEAASLNKIFEDITGVLIQG